MKTIKEITEQITEQIKEAEKTERDSKWPEESYETGVIAALKWVMHLGLPPMQELTDDEIKEIMIT